VLAPSQASQAVHNIDDAFQITVMVGARLGPGIDGDGSSPQFGGASVGGRDRGQATHAWSLRRIGVEFIGRDDFDAVGSPSADCIAHKSIV
jgi:hypothetical protein